MRQLAAALMITLFASQAVAADTSTFSVKGGSGAMAYEGTVRVIPLQTSETETLFMNVEWTFGSNIIRGYGVVAKDDPLVLTVSYVVPAGLGVGRYKIQPDGSAVGVLVGAKGYFVDEVWTAQP